MELRPTRRKDVVVTRVPQSNGDDDNNKKKKKGWKMRNFASKKIILAFSVSTLAIFSFLISSNYLADNQIEQPQHSREVVQVVNGGMSKQKQSKQDVESPKLPAKTCVITISAMNNFGFVWNLHDSIMAHNPKNIDCFLWFIGDSSEPKDDIGKDRFEDIKNVTSTLDTFTIVTMEQMQESLNDFDLYKLAFIFDLVELQTTLKPYAFRYTFQKTNADAVIYLDNDIWVTSSLEELQKQLGSRSVVLTPHCSSPIPQDGRKQTDKNILSSGIFNFGFVAFSRSDSTDKFLAWWSQRLNLYGFVDPPKSMFYDQIWGVFIPAHFDHDDYFVIRDLRYNIAYWNLHERGPRLSMKDGLPHLTNADTGIDEPAVFFHFSGMSLLEKYDVEGISRHQNRFTLHDFPHITEIYDAYINEVSKHNTLHYREIPYAYNHFTDGTKIEKFMRRLYAAAVYPIHLDKKSDTLEIEDPEYDIYLSPFVRTEFLKKVNSNPFCANEDYQKESIKQNYLDWVWEFSYGSVVDLHGTVYFSNLESSIWNKRPDLQHVFPDPIDRNRKDFHQWMNDRAVVEHFADMTTLQKWKSVVKYHRKNSKKYEKGTESIAGEGIGLNIFGWHAALNHDGTVSSSLVSSALEENIRVNAIELDMLPDQRYLQPKDLKIELSRSISELVNLVVVNPGEFHHFEEQIQQFIWSRKYNIAYWTDLNANRTTLMKVHEKFDEIWCSTDHIKKKIKQSSWFKGKLIKVLPIPFSNNNKEKTDSSMTSLEQKLKLSTGGNVGSFVFLTDIDFQYYDRYNPTAAIEAFLGAFKSSDLNFEYRHFLIIKARNGDMSMENRWKKRKLKQFIDIDSRIIMLDDTLSKEENDALYKLQDCYVSLHKGDVSSLNLLVAASVGIPIIATNHGGHVEIMQSLSSLGENCYYPINYKLVDVDKTVNHQQQETQWVEPKKNYAIDAMVKASKQGCTTNAAKVQKEINENYGSAATGSRMASFLMDSKGLVLIKN